MNKNKWLITLEVMSEYMPKVNIVKDILNNMKTKGLKAPVGRQEETLLRLFDKSYKKKDMMTEIKRRLEQDETLQMSKAMNAKFQEQQVQPNVQVYVNTSPMEITRNDENGVVEKMPIGFKQKSISTPSANRYNMNNIPKKETRAEMFNRIFD